MAMSIAIGTERSSKEGCMYRKSFAISIRSAPLPIKSLVSLTNFSIKSITDIEKIMTVKFQKSSFSISLWIIIVSVNEPAFYLDA
jgi:hypothetical protein